METRHIYSAPERELTLQEWCKEFRVGTNLPTPTCDNANSMMKNWTVQIKKEKKFSLLSLFFNLA
jgi:hypothetical protein